MSSRRSENFLFISFFVYFDQFLPWERTKCILIQTATFYINSTGHFWEQIIAGFFPVFFGFWSETGSHWACGAGSALKILIRIQAGKNDPLTKKMWRNFKVELLDVHFSGLEASSLAWKFFMDRGLYIFTQKNQIWLKYLDSMSMDPQHLFIPDSLPQIGDVFTTVVFSPCVQSWTWRRRRLRWSGWRRRRAGRWLRWRDSSTRPAS